MKTVLHSAILGVIAVAVLVMVKLLLSQQAALHQWHYPPFALAGKQGLQVLTLYAAWGAGYAAAHNLLLRSLLPSGPILGPLALGAVPTLVAALVLPLYYGGVAVKEPWTLLWLYAHWTLWAACFMLLSAGKGKGAKRGGGEE